MLRGFDDRIAGMRGIARGLISRGRGEFLWRAPFLAGHAGKLVAL